MTGCTLHNDKDYENTANKYNQNFFGYFCRCHEEYEPKEGEAMLQCVICLEWYHGQCLVPKITETIALEANDLICKDCLNSSVDFLKPYIEKYHWLSAGASPAKNGSKSASKPAAAGPETEPTKSGPEAAKSTTAAVPGMAGALKTGTEAAVPEKGLKRNQPENEAANIYPILEPKRAKTEGDIPAPAADPCRFKELDTSAMKAMTENDVLLKKGWQNDLCGCPKCLKMYHEKQVEKILFAEPGEEENGELHELLDYGGGDDNDENPAEEVKAEAKAGTETTGMGAGLMESLVRLGMGTMPVDRQYQLVDGFRKLTDEFTEHFKKFGQEGKVITREDVEKFFEDFKRKNNETT